MTESTAKTKWCPMTREVWIKNQVPEMTISGFNRAGSENTCLASGCMMWRWEEQKYWLNRINEAMATVGMDVQEATDTIPRKGYCGLGGKP